jgi:hypothetical protein
MLAVGETERNESAQRASKTPARAGVGAAVGAPAGMVAAGTVQRCALAGCACGGTCPGHAPRGAATGQALRGDPLVPAERRGPLPLDATLARAVRARAGGSAEAASSSRRHAVLGRAPSTYAVLARASSTDTVLARASSTDAVPARAPSTDAVPARAPSTHAVPARAPSTHAVPARASSTDAVVGRASSTDAVPARASSTDAVVARASSTDAVVAPATAALTSTPAGVLARSSGGGNGGAAGGGGAPVVGAACKVDVRATHIGGILSGLPIWHLLVVTTDGAGTERYYRGGPGGPGGSPTYGSIITNDGPYVAGTVDWSPGAPSRTVMSGPTACGHDACLAGELRRIDGTATPYAPTGPNSNTVASTILTNCHIPRGKPVWIAPGWDDPVL